MLSKSLENVVKDFIVSIRKVAKVEAEQIAENAAQTIYSASYKQEQEDKIRAASEEAKQKLRDTAINAITTKFENARAVIENSVLEGAHDTTFEEIKDMVEATGGEFTDYEIKALLQKCAGHYWGMRYLGRITQNNTDAAAILKEQFKMPDPEYYLNLFAEEESFLVTFVRSFKNHETANITIEQADINSETLLNGDYFADLHERIEYNPQFMVDDDFEVPTLRGFERRTLRSSGITLDLNDANSKKLVREAARKGGAVRNVLVRTCWADEIREETKRMMEDAEINASIVYGSAGRAAYSGMKF